MSEQQQTPLPDDFRTWLAERGQDAYALAWVAPGADPAGWPETEAPRPGETGIARTGADPTRITLQELTRGRPETLRRWLQLDNGTGRLAIISAEHGGLREHTPGELVAHLMRTPDSDEGELTGLLAGWIHRRNAEAPQGLELGWIAAAAAWTCHMRAFIGYPSLPLLARSLQSTGEEDQDTAELVVSTALRTGELLDRLERDFRPRAELIEDWHAVQSLAADVPALTETADWLLDQIALRDAQAQQLRAVLEPDITDHLRDRRAAGHLRDRAVPVLDDQRTAHLLQVRETVRAYTAAAYSGREEQAQELLDAFPAPARPLKASGPAAVWRSTSLTAQHAVEALAAQRAATIAEENNLFADPELLHAQTAYLAAREGQLHLMHDALGRLADPAPVPRDLPEELAPVAAGQTQRRLIEAFGTTDRAAQVLDGQISYLLQQPVPAHRRDTTGAEADLRTTVRDALKQTAAAGGPFDEEHIRARLRQALARPAAPADPTRAASTGHDSAHTQALAAGYTTPSVHR